jgi:hypothetical protein
MRSDGNITVVHNPNLVLPDFTIPLRSDGNVDLVSNPLLTLTADTVIPVRSDGNITLSSATNLTLPENRIPLRSDGNVALTTGQILELVDARIPIRSPVVLTFDVGDPELGYEVIHRTAYINVRTLRETKVRGLWSRVPGVVAQETLWKDAQGVWHSGIPSMDDLETALYVFLGGHVNDIDEALALEIEAAGFETTFSS